MRRLMIGAGMAGLVVLAAGAARALTVQMQVTPTAMDVNHRKFTVTTKEAGEFVHFDVSVQPDKEGKPLSPFTRADLTVETSDDKLADVRLEPTRKNGKVSWWLRLTPKAIATSTLEIGEQNYVEQRHPDGTLQLDEHGRPQYEQMIGGVQYEIALRDFVRGQ